MRKHDVIGHRYGSFVIQADAETKNGNRYVVAKCDCGTVKTVHFWNLRNRSVISCGCRRREVARENAIKRSRTHGKSGTSTHEIWVGMRDRCLNKNDKGYHRYGGRGITVCERWNSFENFLADMGERPPGMSIDRRNNDLGYEPGNCYWATMKQQARNTRRNRVVEFQGITACLAEHCERLGFEYNTIHSRLKRKGWTVETALSTPVRRVARLHGHG